MSIFLRTVAALGLIISMGVITPVMADETCVAAPDPVRILDHGSRYVESNEPGIEIDHAANLAADNALKVVDDFLRDLGRLVSDQTVEGANCALSQMAVWANGHGLEDLQSQNANLTIGSRISGFGLVTLQAMKHADNLDDLASIQAWLGRLTHRQMVFWEEDAYDGAKRGNLRAWAALAAATSAKIIDDPVMRGWAAWSVHYVLCTANADGSLPQEMRRAKFALHYQLHAIAPLVVASVLLEAQGISLQSSCDRALERVVNFALDDLETGSRTAKITGVTQSFFDGTQGLRPFQIAWIEAYLTLDQVSNRQRLDALAEQHRPLNSSKLGGNQTRIWSEDTP